MKVLITLIFSVLTVGSANAALISFTGTFDNDNTRFYTDFEVTQTSQVTLTSLGYAGGINGEGQIIEDGGFDSQLFIFDSATSLLEADDDESDVVSASSGNSWDAMITRMLSPGTYTVALTQYNNDFVSGNLYTGQWTGAGVSNFVDISGSQRNGQYAFDISGEFIENVSGFDTNPNAVPATSSILLFCLALTGLRLSRKR